MKQSFRMKYRNVISLIAATLISAAIVGASYKSWLSKNINISFNAQSTRDITYKLVYTEDQQTPIENGASVSKFVKTGTTDVKIVLPAQKLVRFRIKFSDRPGLLNISKFKINGQVSMAFDDFAKFNYVNMDSVEVMPDNSVTIISDQSGASMSLNNIFNFYPGYDIAKVKVVVFFCSLFAIFYTFFMLALYKKKKKKKDIVDYY